MMARICERDEIFDEIFDEAGVLVGRISK